jgi:hypothetical protein
VTTKSIEAVLAIYGTVVSTLSILLGIRAHSLAERAYRAAGPIVFVDWVYDDRLRRLTVSVVNTGRSEITIYDLHLLIVHEIIFHRSPSGKYFDSRMETLEEVPKIRWWEGYEPSQLPVRLAANSRFSVHVNSKGVDLLSVDIPIHELALRFVAETPDSYKFADLGGETYSLRHFIGLKPDLPVREHRRRFPYLSVRNREDEF